MSGWMKRALWAMAAVAFAGCGDDGSPETDAGGVVDAGTRDSGQDAGTDAGGRDAGPRDAGPVGRNECDPYAKGGCAEGQKCSVVLENPGEMGIAYFGCVPVPSRLRTEGQFCSRFGEDISPPDGSVQRLTDACEQGTFCWESPSGSLNQCRALCGEGGPDCETDNFCLQLNSDPAFGVCELADGCDPVFQVGCTAGEGCYLLGSGADVVGHCFEVAIPDGGTGAPGQPCMFINNCAPGGACSADLRDGGVAEARCHDYCNAGSMDAGAGDAGTADGGVTRTGTCTAPRMCVRFPLPDGGVARVATVPGQCE